MKRLIKTCRVPMLDDYYDSYEYDYINIGLQAINVNDIVGMTEGRNEDYNEDFTPIDKEDSRWQYQKDLLENGKELEIIPLIKMPNGKYVGNGDGSHRISVLKVFNIKTVNADVSVMVPKDYKIDEQWNEFSKDKQEDYYNLSLQYKKLMKELNNAQDNNELSPKEYQKISDSLKQKMHSIDIKLNEIGSELNEEEKEFKNKLLNKYLEK